MNVTLLANNILKCMKLCTKRETSDGRGSESYSVLVFVKEIESDQRTRHLLTVTGHDN